MSNKNIPWPTAAYYLHLTDSCSDGFLELGRLICRFESLDLTNDLVRKTVEKHMDSFEAAPRSIIGTLIGTRPTLSVDEGQDEEVIPEHMLKDFKEIIKVALPLVSPRSRAITIGLEDILDMPPSRLPVLEELMEAGLLVNVSSCIDEWERVTKRKVELKAMMENTKHPLHGKFGFYVDGYFNALARVSFILAAGHFTQKDIEAFNTMSFDPVNYYFRLYREELSAALDNSGTLEFPDRFKKNMLKTVTYSKVAFETFDTTTQSSEWYLDRTRHIAASLRAGCTIDLVPVPDLKSFLESDVSPILSRNMPTPEMLEMEGQGALRSITEGLPKYIPLGEYNFPSVVMIGLSDEGRSTFKYTAGELASKLIKMGIKVIIKPETVTEMANVTNEHVIVHKIEENKEDV